MRAFICVNYRGRPYKIIWINEDSKGVYIGMYGKIEGTHFSYHKDGNRWFKIGKSNVNKHKATPIGDVDPFNQIVFHALPLNDSNINISGFEYSADGKCTNEIFLERLTFLQRDQVSLDSYLVKIGKEKEFIDFAYSYPKRDPHFSLVGFYLFKLDNFINHKIGILLLSEKS